VDCLPASTFPQKPQTLCLERAICPTAQLRPETRTLVKASLWSRPKCLWPKAKGNCVLCAARAHAAASHWSCILLLAATLRISNNQQHRHHSQQQQQQQHCSLALSQLVAPPLSLSTAALKHAQLSALVSVSLALVWLTSQSLSQSLTLSASGRS